MALMDITFAANTRKRWTDIVGIVPLEDGGVPGTVSPEKFPTLYLLHGFGGNAKDWLTYSNIRAFAEQHKIAVFMPSGENGSYLDNEEEDIHNGAFIEELVNYTRRLFPLSDRREDTWIGGLSMGGFGALRNGAKYSKLFGKVFTLSGAFIIDQIAGATPDYADPIASYGYYRRVFGDLGKVKASENNPIVCLRQAKEENRLPEVFIACGTEDFVIGANRNVKRELDELGIPVNYHEAGGNHDWLFWNEWLVKALAWILGDEIDQGIGASYVNQ